MGLQTEITRKFGLDSYEMKWLPVFSTLGMKIGMEWEFAIFMIYWFFMFCFYGFLFFRGPGALY